MSHARTSSRQFALLAGGLAILTAFGGLTQTASANHLPADKVVAVGSTVMVAGPNAEVAILKATLRTSAPSDLILQLTFECSIFTGLVTGPSDQGGSDSATAQGTVKAWIEIDGAIVPVNSKGDGAAGTPDDQATFCDRAYSRTVRDAEDPMDGQDIEDDYIATKSSHAFNWLDLNLGAGVHNIVVKASLTQSTQGDATAETAIGNRTLIVEPAKLANDASI